MNDYDIEAFGSGYTIYYQGDELYFNTLEEAKQFIEEVAE